MPSKSTGAFKDTLAVLGIASTLVTVLFAARSGYQWIGQRSSHQQMIESWQLVADDIIDAGIRSINDLFSLDVAVYAIEQVAELKSNDASSQQQWFLAQGTLAYLDLQIRPYAYDDWREDLPPLTTEGWKVLELAKEDDDKVPIMLLLAGLESWSPSATAATTAESLLRQALALHPTKAEPRYRLAEHLLEQEENNGEAMQLLSDAIAIEPNNPIYLDQLGAVMLEQGVLEKALPLLEKSASVVNPTSNWMERRAGAASDERTFTWIMALLRAAPETRSPAQTAHIDSLAERLLTGKYRTLWSDNAVLAKYWFQRGDFRRALDFMIESDIDYRRHGTRGTAEIERKFYQLKEDQLPPSLEEIKASLQRLNDSKDIAWLKSMEQQIMLLEEQAFMEVACDDLRLCKIGIKAQTWLPTKTGLLVLRVVPGYPYSRAGIRPGDRIDRINGKPADSLSMLADSITQWAPGKKIPLTVIRDGELLTLELTAE